MTMKMKLILMLVLSAPFSGCVMFEEENQKFLASGINVTITDYGLKEGSKVHHYIYPTDAGYFLNMPDSCDDMNCVGKNVTVGGTSVHYDSYYKRNEMSVKWILVDGRFRGWL